MECLLSQDPREDPQSLDTLVDTYMSTLGGSVTGDAARAATVSQPALPSNDTAAAAGAAGALAGSSNRRRRRGQAEPGPLPILQPLTAEGRDDPRVVGEEPFLTKPNATEVFRVSTHMSCGAESQARLKECVYQSSYSSTIASFIDFAL